MGNYIELILTHGISKKYCYLIALARNVFFGEQTNCIGTIKEHFVVHGVSLYKPFVNSRTSRISLFPYSYTWIKKSIWDMKFKYNRQYCCVYGDLVSDILLEVLAEIELTHNFINPLFCYVPSHSSTIRARGGYYSTHLLAQRVGNNLSHMSIDFSFNLLRKSVKTKRQSHTNSRTERIQNQIGAFSLNQTISLVGRNIILLDDVYTTGTTMTECTKLLKKSGAQRVLQITIAH